MAEYRQTTALTGVYVGLLLLQGVCVASPLFLGAAGLAEPTDPAVLDWITFWLFVFYAGHLWITRPLGRAAAGRIRTRTDGPEGPGWDLALAGLSATPLTLCEAPPDPVRQLTLHPLGAPGCHRTRGRSATCMP